MAIHDYLKVSLDVAKTAGPGQSVTIPPQEDGFDFGWCVPNVNTNTDWWVNPLYPALQLKPLQLKREWSTTTTGDYARLRKSAFTPIRDPEAEEGDPDWWDEIEYLYTGDYWLISLNHNERIQTIREYVPNQPFVVSFRAFGPQGDNYAAITIQFGEHVLFIYSDATTSLYKGTTALGKGKLTQTTRSISGEVVTLLIQPMLGNKILFWSPTLGGGFVHTDTALDETDISNEITAKGPLYIHFPESQGMVQAMHAVYPDSVEYTTPIRALNWPPPAAAEVGTIVDPDTKPRVWYPLMGTSVNMTVLDTDSETEMVWDGTKYQYCVKYELTASPDDYNPDARPNFTPFVTGAWLHFAGETDTRGSDEKEITDNVISLSLQYSQGREGVTGSISLSNGPDWGGTSFPLNRITEITLGTPIFLGFAKRPRRVEAPVDAAKTLHYELESILRHRARAVQLPSTGPFDGRLVTDVVRYLFRLCGAEDAYMVIPDLGGMRFETSGHATRHLYKPQPGDTVDTWFTKIEQKIGYTFDERCVGGNWVFRMYHPDDPTSVVRTFQLGTMGDNACWDYEEFSQEPMCNILGFWYCDSSSRPCMFIVKDEDSLSPDSVTGLREPKTIMIRDSVVRSQAAIERMAYALVTRPGVMDPVLTATWKAQYYPDVFPDDTVTITGKGDYRIRSIDVQVIVDSGDPQRIYYRPATYVGYRRDDV
jgi:hypothetical protein